jgi:hypothetical protein
MAAHCPKTPTVSDARKTFSSILIRAGDVQEEISLALAGTGWPSRQRCQREAVTVQDAIRDADALLPGEPVDSGIDPRWQAIIRVGEYIESDPEPVWQFIRRWGEYSQEDLRAAIATCLLEHLLEYHFETYFPQAEQLALADPVFGQTIQLCSQFGQAQEPGNAKRFVSLAKRLRRRKTK